jgi:EAL domain-containing protein (putative c-di-GMP-specific phosphodiesterase class I)
MLYDMGCKLYQGYYFSKPVSREDFEAQWFD